MDDYWIGHERIYNRQEWHTETLIELEYYESEYWKLEESTALLDLALWKIKFDDSIMDHNKAMGEGNKKMKMDRTEFRLQCRIRCAAN